MPLVFHDRIQENFTTTGTGDITATGAVTGYRPWSTLDDQDTAYYCAEDKTTGDWEIGVATITKAPTPDPYFSQVAVLAHFNGTNGSQTFPNSATISGASSLSAIDVNAKLNTSVKRFNTASAQFPDNISAARDGILLSSSTVNDIGSGDFTIEMFVNLSLRYGFLFDYENAFLGSNPKGFSLGTYHSGFVCYSGGTSVFTVAAGFSNGSWYHVALSRTSGTLRMFLGGTQIYSGYHPDTWDTSAGNGIVIGGGFRNDLNLAGYIDEFRLTVGTGRYTTNFTPTSTEFGTASSTGAVSLARSPMFSSNSNALVSFAAGTKQVFLTVPTQLITAVGVEGGLAVSDTKGFTYLPVCSGTPTGAPYTKSGMSAAVVDSSGSKLWVNVGGVWKYTSLY